jgi:hypothetical protein
VKLIKQKGKPVVVWTNRLPQAAQLVKPNWLLTCNANDALALPRQYSRLATVPLCNFKSRGHGWILKINGAEFSTPDDFAYPRIDALITLAEQASQFLRRHGSVAWELDADQTGGMLACAWAKAVGKSIAFGMSLPSDFALAVAMRMGVRIDYKEAPFADTTLTPNAKALILRARKETDE